MHSVRYLAVGAVLVVGSACSDDSFNSVGSVADAGAAGASGTATGGSATGGSATGGSAGSTGGSAGSTGGSAGSTGGSAGSTGGSAGSTGGSAGSTGGSAGSTGGSAGSTGGSAGSTGGSAGSTGGSAGSTGGSAGSTGGSGGTGGVECPPLPSCNWCGGEDLKDADGCTTGWICANGVDPCVGSGCQGTTDCAEGESCGDDMLCWPADATHVMDGSFSWVANPCTTDPCLPGQVAAVVTPTTTYILVVDDHWISDSSGWGSWTGFVPVDGQPVIAGGRVTYHTDLSGQVYLELEFATLTPRTG